MPNGDEKKILTVGHGSDHISINCSWTACGVVRHEYNEVLLEVNSEMRRTKFTCAVIFICLKKTSISVNQQNKIPFPACMALTVAAFYPNLKRINFMEETAFWLISDNDAFWNLVLKSITHNCFEHLWHILTSFNEHSRILLWILRKQGQTWPSSVRIFVGSRRRNETGVRSVKCRCVKLCTSSDCESALQGANVLEH